MGVSEKCPCSSNIRIQLRAAWFVILDFARQTYGFVDSAPRPYITFAFEFYSSSRTSFDPHRAAYPAKTASTSRNRQPQHRYQEYGLLDEQVIESYCESSLLTIYSSQ